VEEIRLALAGDLCRCGSYLKIVDAVKGVGRGRSMTVSSHARGQTPDVSGREGGWTS